MKRGKCKKTDCHGIIEELEDFVVLIGSVVIRQGPPTQTARQPLVQSAGSHPARA